MSKNEGNNIGYVYPLTEEIFWSLKTDFDTYDDFIDYVEGQGLSYCNFHFSPSESLPEVVYYEEDYIYISMFGNILTRECMKMYRVRETVDAMRKLYDEVLFTDDYMKLFVFLNKRILLGYFINHWEEMPVNIQLEVFNYVYTYLEYNHQVLFTEDIINGILLPNRKAVYKKLITMQDDLDIKDNKLIVYRGEASKSTHYTEGITSWTLDIEIAFFFANRFRTEVTNLYKAEVDIRDVLLLVNDLETKEKDMLIQAKDLQNVELIDSIE